METSSSFERRGDLLLARMNALFFFGKQREIAMFADDVEEVSLSSSQPLSDVGMVTTCSDGSYSYHLGWCSAVSERAFKSRGTKKKNLKYPASATAKIRGNQPSTKQRQNLDIGTELEAFNRKLKPCVSRRRGRRLAIGKGYGSR